MRVEEVESIILYVSDLAAAKTFYVEFLGLPVIFEDLIVLVLGKGPGRIVLHRSDRGHDERGIFPAGKNAGAAALRFNVNDPDAWEKEAIRMNVPLLWQAQEASWGRFVVIGDPDGRPIVLARMHRSG